MAPPTVPTSLSGRSALDVARDCAREAGRIALEAFRRPQRVETKGRGNLVSETDFAIERFLHEALAREFPDHRVLSEETATDTAIDGWVWVVDPLDGTRNFVSGIPFFCINIALCRDGEPLVAVTYDPNHDEAFSAERGRGAWLNDASMRASDAPTVLDSVLGFDLGYDDERGRGVLQLIHALFPGAQSVRIPGSAALGLAYAACGRYDLFVHHYLFPWDIAAGILLVQEAGGVITNHLGGPIDITSQTVIAGAPRAHADFLRWQQEHRSELDLLSTT
jgi:myo-inositol-1(or 4)-monophosphatase